MRRSYYSETITKFVASDPFTIQGHLSRNSEGPVEQDQINAWEVQIRLLQEILSEFEGKIYFEFSVPRMGKRIDVVLLIGAVIFVLEFKAGAQSFSAYAVDQVWDYGLDLKNFHETSHHCTVAPILISTGTMKSSFVVETTPQNDNLFCPVQVGANSLLPALKSILAFADTDNIDPVTWEHGRYCPTPTIIEVALALYRGHNVKEISRSDADSINLHETTAAISSIIESARLNPNKAICFVTGVPGAGKTLVGLDIATKYLDYNNKTYSVFLSGNGPLVNILQEALALDLIERKKAHGERISKKVAKSEVKAFVQNVHHYRDDCLRDDRPPVDHVALFDEAQRAWNKQQTVSFMKNKKGCPDFDLSEPEFLISCVDRHPDWGVVVCLVGGGQEIHTGEAGIGEWIDSLNRRFPDWHIYISSRLTDSEYEAGAVLDRISGRENVYFCDDLHLSVSMRSFRAENVSLLVKQILDIEVDAANQTLGKLKNKYPIVLTRDVAKAKDWLRSHARGSERYGMVVSSQAERLKPHAIDVKRPMDPVHWFLKGKEDVRSSYYLEDVASEFSIQGLELDWVCVTWDADFRFSHSGWVHKSFRGSKWLNINKEERQSYQKNAYRVLLTRARQGMVIVVPEGDINDPTRAPSFYDPTYEYLESIGFDVI